MDLGLHSTWKAPIHRPTGKWALAGDLPGSLEGMSNMPALLTLSLQVNDLILLELVIQKHYSRR